MAEFFQTDSMNCGGCPSHKAEEKQSVPRIVHEADMARMERSVKRSWILSIILIILLAGTNAAWIYYENSFEDTVTVTQESSTEGGGNAFVNNGGDLNYGTGKADSDQN